ncbi:hypothetical protein [Burkholderia sp. NLJ2]|uniref:hypothetical protein n=1 Tax=Burkholderia sp. NLJ2 TaxID=3090699 RepID=UPI003C6C20FF
MIEANVDALPEGIARRDAKTIAPRLVALENDRAEREQRQISVTGSGTLPRFARDLAVPLVEVALAPD